ncbi:putative disease resistance protein RGA3 [Quercus lobata]|uniref:putative disease resistance protein RGA3 n=1 Tax=Quercus lobata TaxID=97700 RepID=UPI001244DD06|nr:putative disease resistance protein RGA3 [Quercus lobata]
MSLKIWLLELKDVAYEADNVLDEFGYEILRRKMESQKRKKVRSFFSPSNPIVFPFKMGNKIKSINQSLDRIKTDVALLGLRESLNPIPKIGLDRETDSFIDDSEVVGRGDDVLKIVNLLIGLGKTTTAKLVYNHELVKKHFDVKMWVCVSDNFDVKRILREILEILDNNCSGLENKNAILHHLQEKLQGKRYLLILDDMWDEDREKWDGLRSSLLGINQNNVNNILVTFYKDNVAQIMKTSLIHKLEKLSEDECWLIFKEKAFANERILVTPDLEDIGRKIAKRCGGNPLAARVLGGMMRLKEDKSEWLLIQNSKTWDSMEDNNGVFPILKLSFDHLPTPSLKQCFAYCSIFPKDFIIEKKLLVQLWMAEGFLQTPKRSFSVIEDIGNKYFDFLVANSLFQDLERDSYGDITWCKMHDLALSILEGETLHLEAMKHGKNKARKPEFRPLRRFSRPISACFGRFRPVSAVSAVSVAGRYGRYGPSRPDFGRVGPISAASAPILAASARVGPSRDPPRGPTRHDAERTRGLRRPSRVAASPPRRTRVRRLGSRVRASLFGGQFGGWH